MPNDPYANVAKSKLKLKTDSDISKKKKKHKSRDKDKDEEKIANVDTETIQMPAPETSKGGLKFTKAELSFRKMQEKMVSSHIDYWSRSSELRSILHLQQNKRIRERAAKTHKQQVEEFNERLDNLTEHFDIPKVSWTK